MATAGAQNGTGIYVAMDVAGGSTYVQIGGQNSHSLTLNNSLIDITNKSSASFRELLPDQGTQSIDLTLDLTFNSQTTFASLRTIAGTKADATFRINMPGGNLDFTGMVASFADTSPDGDKLSASVSIQSTGSFTWN
jgi:predicted secreted protein|tara:strand:+ start:4325 stop:4735 length:411 start_codon:yes stop_codon:yes gene_type:complete